MGLWGQPTPFPLSPPSSLPPHPTFAGMVGGWISGLEPLSYTFCCVCDVGSACDRVLPFCLAVALLPFPSDPHPCPCPSVLFEDSLPEEEHI